MNDDIFDKIIESKYSCYQFHIGNVLHDYSLNKDPFCILYKRTEYGKTRYEYIELADYQNNKIKKLTHVNS